MKRKRLILASGSPRRADLLRQIGLEFEVIPSDIDEDEISGDSPQQRALNAALAKAMDVARKVGDGIVIGADTIVLLEGKILGKPSSPEEAVRMLTLLSGKTHQVITGVALIDVSSMKVESWTETTFVTFRVLSNDEIIEYVKTGIPLDKAGAYGIQDKAAAFVKRIEGCYFNVVGLPLAALIERLRKMEFNP
ncbi:TPA: septum formation inhibitor Maf [Candidatus Poribacteria bacterium]|nr:septum formation inhibitor Maf [Candidatus Poribacteria bacterium]HEX30513.1 septum formation inhibitor Maf [Candidatus Poribacteria bacterium]